MTMQQFHIPVINPVLPIAYSAPYQSALPLLLLQTFGSIRYPLLPGPLVVPKKPFSQPPKNGARYAYTSFQEKTICYPSYPYQYPTTLNDLQYLVRTAIIRGTTIKAVGSSHSATDVICTDGIPVKMSRINFVKMNSDDTVTVGAGAELMDVVDALNKRGRALIHIPTYGGITIGGAMGCGSHGSSLFHPTAISDLVVGMTLVDGVGRIQNISEPNDLNAFRVHLGLLGIIYSVTLKTVPGFKMQIFNYPDSDKILFNGEARRMARQNDYFQLWWFPSDRSVVVSKGNYIAPYTMGNATTNLIPDLDPGFVENIKNIMELQQDRSDLQGMRLVQTLTQLSLHKQIPEKPPIFTEDGKHLVNPAVGNGYNLMANRCKPESCGWDIHPEESAVAMDLKELPRIPNTIKSILAESPAEFPMIGFYFRFSKASDNIMAIEHGRETVHIDWVMPARFDPFSKAKAGLGAHQAIMQALIDRHGGRPHWGKNGLHYFKQKTLQETAPNLELFKHYMMKYDPIGVFLNDFGKRILGLSDDITLDPREIYCGLRDNCICETDYDCGTEAICTQVAGYNVCQKREIGYFVNLLKQKGKAIFEESGKNEKKQNISSYSELFRSFKL